MSRSTFISHRAPEAVDRMEPLSFPVRRRQFWQQNKWRANSRGSALRWIMKDASTKFARFFASS